MTSPRVEVEGIAFPAIVEPGGVVYVMEGWWHYNALAGRVHDHPESPGRGWSETMHRLCEPVYTRREP